MTTEAASGPVPNNRQPIASVAHTLGLLLINVGIAVLGDRGPDALDRRLGVGGGTQRSGSALLVAHRHGVGAALLHLARRAEERHILGVGRWTMEQSAGRAHGFWHRASFLGDMGNGGVVGHSCPGAERGEDGGCSTAAWSH